MVVGALAVAGLASCGDRPDVIVDAAVVRPRGAAAERPTLPPPSPLPPGARFALGEHAVAEASAAVDAGDTAAARDALARGLAFDPMNRQAIFVRGRIALAEGRPEEAVTAFEEARVRRDDVAVREWLGFAHLARHGAAVEAAPPAGGDAARAAAEDARRAFAAAVELEPGSGNARHNLGYATRLAGRPAESVTILRALVDEQPERVRTLYELGVSQRAAGLPEDARRTWRRLLDIQPDHGAARAALEALGG